VLCVQDKTCKFFLPRIVITQVMNLFNGIWTHHILSNKVGQNSCPLDNIHFKFSVICVRFMYKYLTLCYIFFLFLSDAVCLLKTFLVICKYRDCFQFTTNCRHRCIFGLVVLNIKSKLASTYPMHPDTLLRSNVAIDH